MSRVSAVVPATAEAPTLARCRAAIERAAERPDELLVISRGCGPAAARNAGAREATGEVVVFVDADVEVHRDAFTRIRAAFDADPGLTALFGAYDDRPPAPDAVSGFRNLLHHFVHMQAAGRAETFWAGLGAVRRDAFLAAGGFDELRYRRPSIEDIEFGARLSATGARIELDPTVQGTHLKRWTLLTMVDTDLRHRGIPWMRLILAGGTSSRALNLGATHRASMLTSVCVVGAVVTRRPRLVAAALGLLVSLNRAFYSLLLRRRGAAQASTGVSLHVLHHLTGVTAALVGTLSWAAGVLWRQAARG